MRTLLTVLKKELIDAMRDRRAWAVVLVTTLISGPATMLGLSKFVADLKARSDQREVTVEGAQYAPGLVNYFARQGRTVKPPEADYRARIEAGQFDDAVLQVPPTFADDFKRGTTVELTVLHDAQRAKSATAASTLDRLVNGWSMEQGMQRLSVRGVDTGLLHPTRTTLVSLGSARGGAARMLFLVPLIALIAAVIGALSTAIDVTAGERERGSLEPLLMNPMPLSSIVVGKWLAVSAGSLLTLAGTIASFAVAAQFIRDEALAAAFQFGVTEAALSFALLAPFCFFISAVLMLAAVFARGHKEAQASTSYVVSLVSVVPSLSIFLSLQDSWWQLLVPAMGQNMVLARAFRGSAVTALDVVLPAVVSLALAGVALVGQRYLLSREAIVFARG